MTWSAADRALGVCSSRRRSATAQRERARGRRGAHRAPSARAPRGSTRWRPSASSSAREEAAAADSADRCRRTEETLPPLLGVPFTVKESIALRGMPQSTRVWWRGASSARPETRAAGAAADRRRRDPAGRDQHLGAVAVDRVDQPRVRVHQQSLRRRPARPAARPAARARRSGRGGSPFGVGSDIGGSIRVPAFFCGVFGHKPSPGLVPNTGHYPPTAGEAAEMLAHRPAGPPRRGPDAAAVDHGRARTAIDPCAKRDDARRPGGGVARRGCGW